MANLIITVIAIALVAIASLMGAYYGGSAFLEGSAKAQAATIASQGQQIAAAWVLYANDKGNVYDLGSTFTGSLTPSYLLEVPTAPSAASSFSFVPKLKGTFNSTATASFDAVALQLNTAATDICNKLNTQIGGTYGEISAAGASPVTNRYGCFGVNSTTTNTTVGDTGDSLFFLYKVR